MTAPALNVNPAATPPGLPGAPGQAKKAADGPLGGFEAVFASLFGQAAFGAPVVGAGTVPTPAASKDAATDAPATSEDAKTPAEGEAEPATTTDATASPDPNLAGLILATAGKAAEETPAAPATETTAPPAYGRGKGKGVPAAPALAHADPHAGLAEKAALKTDDPAEPEVESPTPAQLQKTKLDPPAAGSPQARGRQASVIEPPVSPKAERAELDAPLAADIETAAAATEATTPEAAAPAVTLAAAKPATTASPGRGPQGPKGERGRDAIDATGASRQSAAARKAAETAPDAPVAAAASADQESAEASARAPETHDAPDSASVQPDAPLQTTSAAPSHAAHTPVRGAPETVANLAAQIVKKLEGRSTRFDLELDPAGLGRVDVRLEIGAAGQITAAMTFDNPGAAAEVKARANELQRALEQAGFNLSGGLSFDVAGDRGNGRQAWEQANEQSGQGFRGRAFQDAINTAGDAVDQAVSGALRLRRGLTAGLDVRI